MNTTLSNTARFGAALLSLAATAAFAAPLPVGWTTNGNAGTNTAADGVVSLAPGFSAYQWVSTENGIGGGGNLPTNNPASTTNGATIRTSTFAVAAGDSLSFFFNYITSDGAGFSDFAWAGLFSGTSTFDKYLFTARTTTSGNTVPGFGLPGIGAGVTLLPSSTPIIGGAPNFSPLGTSSGRCFDSGCGYTGWIKMNYNFTAAGVYSLRFGVANFVDTSFDSAFAIAGVAINDIPVEPVPTPATLALVALGLLGVGLSRRAREA